MTTISEDRETLRQALSRVDGVKAAYGHQPMAQQLTRGDAYVFLSAMKVDAFGGGVATWVCTVIVGGEDLRDADLRMEQLLEPMLTELEPEFLPGTGSFQFVNAALVEGVQRLGVQFTAQREYSGPQ